MKLLPANRYSWTGLIARFCGSAAALVVSVPSASHAQHGGVVGGVTVDSVRGGPLIGALVHVSGTSLSDVSDSAGRFRISGLPAGTYRLEVVHPFLDTLRLAVRTAPRQSTGADSLFLVVSTPSAAALVTLKCTAEERRRGGAMALGFVTHALTDEPAENAQVTAEWTDYIVQGRSLSRKEQKRSAVVGPDGSYKLCGIPEDLETGVFARNTDDTTAARMAVFRSGLSILSFRLSPPRQAPPIQTTTPSGEPSAAKGVVRGSAKVFGRVIDSAGRPIARARVSSEDGATVTLTRNDGSFELTGLRPGTRGIVVRRLGFLPVTRTVDVGAETSALDIAMTTFVPVLEAVRISARRTVLLEQVGFASRSRTGLGRYFSPDDIHRRNPLKLDDLLSMVPSLRVRRDSRGNQFITGRFGECVRYFVDGRLWADFGEGPDAFISGHELGAVEVYSGLSAPGQFTTMGRNGTPCSAVVIWTKWKLRI